VKAILFDVDGTLFRHSRVRRGILGRLARCYAVHPLAGLRTVRALAAYRAAQEELRRRPAAGNPAEEQLRLACASSGLAPPAVRAAVERWMEREPLSLLPAAIWPGVGEFLVWAKRKGLRLAVCSDYPAQAKLQALGMARLFDAVVCAQDAAVGRFKPDPKMLLVALERLRIAPQEAVFVGDRSDVDGEAARAAGVPFIRIGAAGYSQIRYEFH